MGRLSDVSVRMTAEEILSLVDVPQENIKVNGYLVRTTSLRYAIFRKQPKCACCERRISYGILQTCHQSKQKRAHFNLFSKDGMLMTKDHIKPKSKGGKNKLSNLQTMCLRCNSKKGDTW